MTTKSGKQHYTATLILVGKTGIENWRAPYKFSAKDPVTYMKKKAAEYGLRGEWARFENLVDLDA